MSRRNSRDAKRKRRLIKSLTIGLPARIDLVEWVRARKHMSRGMARKIIFAGYIRSESHVVGVRKLDDGRAVLDTLVPAELRPTLRVEAPK